MNNNMGMLISTGRNIHHRIVESGDKRELLTDIEAVVHVMTRQMKFIGKGLTCTEDVDTIRFTMTLEGAKSFITHVAEWIEDAEKAHSDLVLKSEAKATQ